MLNAFRHHGLYRRGIVVRRTAAQRTSCSTPFGITDYIGTPASRKGYCKYLCSTPFGITDYIGRGRRWPDTGRRSTRAQRLSASRIISDVVPVAVYGRINKCSTPFGITDYIGIASIRRRSAIALACAQRLSASRIISAGATAGADHQTEMCSTPFGITDYIGWPTPAPPPSI